MDTTLSLDAQAAALDNREEMLRTLHLAYRNILDKSEAATALQIGVEPGEPRLTKAERKELGRRICLYWDVGRDILPKPAPRPSPEYHAPFDQLWKRYELARTKGIAT